ncbi:MAG: bifunctional phosphoribosylaminoimidazolecarboxamide formyltransferase/IMP cyclohydrolase [Planctomycetota bacterium]
MTKIPVRRALVSVSDKSGLEPLCRALEQAGAEIVSTGGTARAIEAMGIEVVPVEKLTGFPEMMDGRLKTLHPVVHGGLLARRDTPEHMAAASEHGIGMIDLLCVNLYPFEQTVAGGAARAEAIEQIDIGGPAMVRAAAKNHASVAVVTDPAQYGAVIEHLQGGGTDAAFRSQLAATAYAHTSAYDAAIAAYLSSGGEDAVEFPETLTLRYTRTAALRYGENPHQSAAVYSDPAYSGTSVVSAEQLHGKPLSYNNINDAAAALQIARSIAAASGAIGSCVVKHTNPCGAGSHTSTLGSVDLSMRGDEMAAFGGILATTGRVDLEIAERLCVDGVFLEVVVAPSVSGDALARLRERWMNLRVLAVGDDIESALTTEYRAIPGGLLAQVADTGVSDHATWTHKAGPLPDAMLLDAARVLEPICRGLSSNAVLIGGRSNDGVMQFGAGAGQMDRVASCQIAVEKAGDLAKGAVAFSDAFFPFDDGPSILADAGVSLIVHPGGSKRDGDTFALCDTRGVSCVTTGKRHFRH